jgi:hypothetical protein
MVKASLSVGLLLTVVAITWSQTPTLDPPSNVEVPPAKTMDKSLYNLFNPTPTDQMRAFLPDRPNVTDAPYTVDAGHLLVEMGLLEYSLDRYNSEHTRLDAFALVDTNVRLGITNYAEVDVLFTAYSYIRTKDEDAGEQLKHERIQ